MSSNYVPDPDGDSDLVDRADQVEPEKKLACPKGHETGVREIGCGKYFCVRCGRTWTQ